MNTGQIRDAYDQWAERYDTTIGLAEKLLLGDLRRVFGSQLRGETLEIAIGTALNLPYYAEAVTRAVGADLSAGMLRIAVESANEVDQEIELVQGDAERLPFPDSSFDTVAISLALCTVPRPEAALREIARVCRTDGVVVYLEHVRSPYRLISILQRLWTPFQERALGCSWVRDTVTSITDAGFTIVAERSRLFGVFRLVVARPPVRA